MNPSLRTPGGFSPELQKMLEVVQQQAAAQTVYLVGGAVRDLLLGRSSHDLDFTLAGDPRPLARKVANALKGDFYVLDDLRNTARAITYSAHGSPVFLDFSVLRGAGLDEDLFGRDFTANAIAFEIHDPRRLLDPTGGLEDLRLGRLRACSPTSFSDDPARILRGVRQSLAFGFELEAGTWQAMRAAAPLLRRVSAERQRDELFNMLEGRHVARAMRLLDQAGVLSDLLPEVSALKGEPQGPPHIFDVWDHTLALVDELERLFDALVEPGPTPAPPDAKIEAAALVLGRYKPHLARHLGVRLNPHRSLRSLLFLAGLLHDAAKPSNRQVEPGGKVHFIGHDKAGIALAQQRGAALALSQVENQRLSTLVGVHMRIHLLAQAGPATSRRAIFRFFRTAGPAGVDLCLLSLADTLATYGPGLPEETWAGELEVCRLLLDAWCERPTELVHPPRLLTGADLLVSFKMHPGPQVGELLAAIQEAQAAGEITTRDEAMEFVKHWLENS